MSADLLRRAAALIRERAEAATPGAWLTDDQAPGVVMSPDTPDFTWDGVFVCSTQIDQRGEPSVPDAAHIASWHPAVALAVADLLDNEASLISSVETHPDLHMPLNNARCDLLLAVARAYLGEAS